MNTASRAFSSVTAVIVSLIVCACGGAGGHDAELMCREEEGQQRCVTTGGPGQALVTGGAAAALWGAGGGCKIAGCQPPLECNLDTGLCQPMRCGEDLRECPPAYHCDMKTRTCK
jgi:hypothetical protein